jgi:hypothetical protein
MKQPIAWAVLAALIVATPTAAEPQRVARGVLPPHEILTIIRSTGLDPLDRPRRRGSNYVLHAIDDDGREVRVLVNGRSGRVVSLTPVEMASRLPPGAVIESYGPPRYVEPGAVEIDEPEPPVVYEAEPPVGYPPRPSAEVPDAAPPARRGAGPRVITATPDRPEVVSSVPGPRVITATEAGRDGLLPPPPERFPQRAAPGAAKPKPAVRRTVASLPKRPPLPRPRPGSEAEAAPPPDVGKPEADKPAATALPN